MIRNLLIIAGAALVLSIFTIGGAIAIGGKDLQRNGWAWSFQEDDNGVRLKRLTPDEAESYGPETTKTVAWNGGVSLINDAGLDIEYVQGPENTVVMTGPQNLLDLIKLEDGRFDFSHDSDSKTIILRWDNNNLSSQTERGTIKIVVTAPNVSRFEINGSGDLSLRDYNQPSLTLAISGSGDVKGNGTTETLVLDIAGSGDASLEDLTTKNVTASISGSGDIELSPSGDARISIAGSGDVSLKTKPATLISNISGSGEVRQN